MTRGHRGIQQIFDLDAPVIVACKGWSIGASFQRALLCDVRIAAEGAIDQRPLSRFPRSAAKQAPESNRGKQTQSMEPLRETNAAGCVSPMSA